MDFIIYNIDFKNFEAQDLTVQIQDRDTLEDPPGDTVEIDLQGSENVCVLESMDNDSDKTKAIKSRRLRFGFNSNATYDVGTFSDGSDTRFLVALKRTFADSFQGFISLDDITEAFQPKPNPVALIAGDGLGFLKNQELKTIADELPLGKFTIMDYIVMCLTKTGLNMTINVVMNLFEEDADPVTEHSWNLVYLDALTFEKDIDEREDCYTVLNKILDAFGCFITQDYEGWWIVRWDEYDAISADRTTLRVARFGADGAFIQYEEVVMDKIIVADYEPEHEGHYLSQDTATRRFQRMAKIVDHTFKYNLPRDLPCNKDLLRGDFIIQVGQTKKYELDCWDLKRGFGSGEVAPTITAQIHVLYDINDYEDQRYMVLSMPLVITAPINYVLSQGIYVEIKDKIDFGIDYSAVTDNNVSGSTTISLIGIRLLGDDGSYWALQLQGADIGQWKATDADFTTNTGVFQWVFDASLIDLTDWNSFSIESDPVPIGGLVHIHLYCANQTAGASDDFDIRYQNITFDYHGFIDGTYKAFEGQRHRVSQNEDARVIEKEIFISDSPKRIFKGTMFKEQSSPSGWILTENWDDYTAPTAVGVERLGKHLVFSWWNQFRKTRTVIDSDIQGIKTDLQNGVPAMQYRYEIHHGDESAKYFVLNSYSMDFRTCGWAGVFIENSSGDGDRIYTDTHEFKYLTE